MSENHKTDTVKNLEKVTEELEKYESTLIATAPDGLDAVHANFADTIKSADAEIEWVGARLEMDMKKGQKEEKASSAKK